MLWCGVVLCCLFISFVLYFVTARDLRILTFVCVCFLLPLSTFFSFLYPDTTRPMGDRDIDGRGYFFTDRETMERDIRENKFLDYGEFDGELYGIKFSTVRAIIKTGRVCVMAVSPNVRFLV